MSQHAVVQGFWRVTWIFLSAPSANGSYSSSLLCYQPELTINHFQELFLPSSFPAIYPVWPVFQPSLSLHF